MNITIVQNKMNCSLLFFINLSRAILLPADHDWLTAPEVNGTCNVSPARGPLTLQNTFWSVWVVVGGEISDLLNPKVLFKLRIC